MQKRAFSFIELFIVIVIAGVLAGISFPAIRHTYNGVELHQSARLIQSAVNYLYQRSVSEQKVFSLVFDEENRQLLAKDEDSRILKVYSLGKDLAIKLTKKNNPEEIGVFFYPDGSIDQVDLELSGPDKGSIFLTTEGIIGKIKEKQPEK